MSQLLVMDAPGKRTVVPDISPLVMDPNAVPLGSGLLPADLHSNRDKLLHLLSIAARNVLADKEETYALWWKLRQMILDELNAKFQRRGITAPRFQWIRLRAELAPPLPPPDTLSYARLVAAVFTDFTEDFTAHLVDRLNQNGNVHLEISGPTGMGKSSIAISIADYIRRVPADRLLSHVSIDVADLPAKFKGKTRGDTVIQDEFPELTGQGSRTIQALFKNLEDTLRASGINLIVLSPRKQEHATSQAELEVILWNRTAGFTVCLVWLDGIPVGILAIAWCRTELWVVYSPWKDANVARSLSGHFKDNLYLLKMAIAACEDERFVSYIEEMTNKPRRADFADALELFPPQTMAANQSEVVARMLHTVCYNLRRLKDRMEPTWGVKPTRNLERVALRCYDE